MDRAVRVRRPAESSTHCWGAAISGRTHKGDAMMPSLRSRFLLAAALVALLSLLVAGGRGASADTSTPNTQPSPALPAPTNIQQSWDGTKGTMTISFDQL